MGQDTRETWSKRVERWKDSGLTAKEFAAETGINVNSLTHWKWKLAAQARSQKTRQEVGASEPHFVEVSAPKAIVERTLVVAAQVEPLELVLRDGLRVRVPVRFDETVLRRVMDVLAAVR